MSETWTGPSLEESAALNNWIAELEETPELFVDGLRGTGKVIPFIGWFWRTVTFTQSFPLGQLDCQGTVFQGVVLEKPGRYIGFMENNKWDYDEWFVSEEQRRGIIDRLRGMMADGATVESLQSFFDYVQTCTQEVSDEGSIVDCSPARTITLSGSWPGNGQQTRSER